MAEHRDREEDAKQMCADVIKLPNNEADQEQIKRIQEQVEDRATQEAEKFDDGDGGDDDISSSFVRDCLQMNELGDGLLFRELHQGKFLFNKAMGEWMVWSGHYWDVDTMDLSKSAVEQVVAMYIREAVRVSAEIRNCGDSESAKEASLKELRKALNSRVSALRSIRRRNNCLGMAHTCDGALAIHGKEIDRQPWLLACPNAVINLKSGEAHDGKPEEYLHKHAAAEWKGIDEPCPEWDKFLAQIMEEDHLDPEEDGRPMVEFLQRLMGQSIVGETSEHIFTVFEGIGRNGKGTIQRVIIHVLGNLAGPVRSEMMLDQSRNVSSDAPTPGLMALRGLRVAFASETDEGCRVSAARVKWMTGGDELTGRSPHDKLEVTWTPTHSLFLMTNSRPSAPADDFAFWQRMHLVPFKLSFVKREPSKKNERKADPGLENRLMTEDSGILAWMVRGCLRWQQIGLAPPPQVMEANKEYQENEDNVGAFIDYCCFVDKDREDLKTGATVLYEAFEAWWIKFVSRYPLKQKKFGQAMRKKGFASQKIGGIYNYYGIGLLTTQDDGVP